MIDESLLKINREGHQKIMSIVRRVKQEYPEESAILDTVSTAMDLTVCANRGHVDLNRMLAAPTFDLMHDIAGIANHLDRETGDLCDCFLPRCAPLAEQRERMKR